MITFAIDITKQKQERLKAYLFNLSILSMPIIYDLAVPKSFIKSSYYFFVASFFIVNLVKEILSEKTFEVTFDTDNHIIMLTSKTLFSKPKMKAIPFGEARLEYFDEGSFLLFKADVKLYFMKGKMEVACLRERSKGFSKETMNEIVKKAQDNNLPVSVS